MIPDGVPLDERGCGEAVPILDIFEADIHVPPDIEIVRHDVAVVVIPIHQSAHNFAKEIAGVATEMVLIVVGVHGQTKLSRISGASIIPDRIELSTTYRADERGMVIDAETSLRTVLFQNGLQQSVDASFLFLTNVSHD